MTITVYSFEDAAGNDMGWTTQDYREAKRHAAEFNLAVIANKFEFSDSELVDDFRPKKKGSNRAHQRQ